MYSCFTLQPIARISDADFFVSNEISAGAKANLLYK
jgi:hypothetical protein